MIDNVNTDLIFDRSNLKWLNKQTKYLVIHGSHAYGLARPDSDIDIRGVAIAPKQYYFGVLDKFDQAQFSDPYDCTIFDLKKFVTLALDCNPNVIELLYVPERCILRLEPAFERFLEIRDEFLSKKARYTFSGYARSQLLRLSRHRRWIMNQDKYEVQPKRSDYGLPDNKKLLPDHKLLEIEAQVTKKLSEWNFDSTGLERDVAIDIKNRLHDILVDIKVNQDEMHLYAARSIGLNDNLIEAFKKERMYAAALKEWRNYHKWKKERNRERYETEKKFSFDTKHASHLVRLFFQCVHLLKTGEILIDVSDIQEISDVKQGKWTYEQLMEWADNKDKELEELYKSSKLKREPNRKLVNRVLIETIEQELSNAG